MRIANAILVMLCALGAWPVGAECAMGPGKLARASLLRCESTEPYLQSAVASDKISTEFVEWLKRTEPGPVLVVSVLQEINLGSKDAEWQRANGHRRFYWAGPREACDAKRGSPIELYIQPPCCDGGDNWPCVLEMDIARVISNELLKEHPGVMARQPEPSP